MEEIAFNDWPGQDLHCGPNSWLPAYGFEPPSSLLERDDFLGNPDADFFLQNYSTPSLYLETIHEETSDDLYSENNSDISEVQDSSLAWLPSDSETDSVTCMETINEIDDCESDREIACPIKRRRQDTNFLSLPEDNNFQSLSRTSSLLQFESLEKQCQETSSSSPSIYSQFSYDSLEVPYQKQRITANKSSGSGSSSSSETCSNDSDTTLAPSKSETLLMKTWSRSFDSLIPQTTPKKEGVSAENLSEDSGYNDTFYFSLNTTNKSIKARTNWFEPATRQRGGSSFVAYDYCEVFSSSNHGNVSLGASCQNLSILPSSDYLLSKWATTHSAANLILEKTNDIPPAKSKYNCISTSEPNLGSASEDEPSHIGVVNSVPKNLNVLSVGFSCCDNVSVAAKNVDLSMAAGYRREGSYARAMADRVDLSDDEHGYCYKKKLPKTPLVDFDRKILNAISESLHSINPESFTDAYLSSVYNKTSAPSKATKQDPRKLISSTPNLTVAPREEERLLNLLLTEEDRRRSSANLQSRRKSSLINHSTSTSCVSDIEDQFSKCGSSKGVHFSPVVSEVNWKETDSQSTSSTIEPESISSVSPTPERDIAELTHALLMDTTRFVQPRGEVSLGGSQPALNSSSLSFARKQESFKSQPDVSKMRRRGSQLIKKDGDGCVVKAYVDVDGIQYKHTHLDLDDVLLAGGSGEPAAPSLRGHVGTSGGSIEADVVAKQRGGVDEQQQQQGRRAGIVGMEQPLDVVDAGRKKEQQHAQKGKLGGFFSRLASFRFTASSRKHDKNKRKGDFAANKKKTLVPPTPVVAQQQQKQKVATKSDYIFIPLKGPASPAATDDDDFAAVPPRRPAPPPSSASLAAKPPLPRAPPRVVGACAKKGADGGGAHHHQQRRHQQQDDGRDRRSRRRTIDSDSSSSCHRPMEPMGLIETDLDTDVTVITSGGGGGGPSCHHGSSGNGNNVKTRSLLDLGAEPCLGGGLLNAPRRHRDVAADNAAGSRPHKSMEFLLDKQNLKVIEPPENELQKGERVMSEHQLRVQRSLQKLTVPDWYKHNQVPREGFLLLKNKTPAAGRWQGTGSRTTSLSSLGGGAASPTVSPSQPFARWSTSKLNSTASSPCASTRSSFHRAQPNGDGSLSPASVRSSFSYRQPYMGWRSQERLAKPRTPSERLANSLIQQESSGSMLQANNNSDIQTSIKEVTSAIVHYVKGLRPEASAERSRSASPNRGSQKLCWLESSFVGIRPLDSPQTPITLAAENQQVVVPPTSLRLQLQSHNDVSLLSAESGLRPSPGSTTLEDVLDSLLGLPSSERAPSPSLQARITGTASANTSPSKAPPDDHPRRRSDPTSGPPSRRVSFHSSPVLQCRYSRCARVVSASSLEGAAFKFCHNCSYSYCSKTCRRAHWEKHRKTCLFSRIGTLCRQIIASIKEQKDTLFHLSLIARRGYLAQGPGAVKCFFPCPETAERFLTRGLTSLLGEPTYVPWLDLQPSEMGPQLYGELVQMCKTYNPESKLILYVNVCVVSETPASGAVKWERQLVSRCAKMRLSRDVSVPGAKDKLDTELETLIFTSPLDSSCHQESKETCVRNIEKQLLDRGVFLQEQHPVLFKQLCAYANGSCAEKFTPVTVYPKDGNTGKSFMCIIMLEADPDTLKQVELAGVRVRTVNVLCGT